MSEDVTYIKNSIIGIFSRATIHIGGGKGTQFTWNPAQCNPYEFSHNNTQYEFHNFKKREIWETVKNNSTTKKEIHLLPEYNAQQEVFIWIDSPCTKKKIEIFHVEEPKANRHPF
ncbi:MAG: hypothetical protein JKY11_04840 [Alphaproteobacteria bacterium]|nr:hypothetical protein [Alphaproteobacteria bacterium]